MLKRFFRDTQKFTFLFFFLLIIDICVKTFLPVVPYRFLSKPFIVGALIIYYVLNNKEVNSRKKLWMILGLSSFFIGDFIILFHSNMLFLAISIFLFSLGKIFFFLKFSHKQEFSVTRLIPFSLLLFIYTTFLVSYVLEGLGDFLVPALVSFFLTLLMVQFAFLRKGVFSKRSYILVLVGCLFFVSSEAIMAIKTFRYDLYLQEFFIMLFYGVAMYLITIGIVDEVKSVPIQAS